MVSKRPTYSNILNFSKEIIEINGCHASAIFTSIIRTKDKLPRESDPKSWIDQPEPVTLSHQQPRHAIMNSTSGRVLYGARYHCHFAGAEEVVGLPESAEMVHHPVGKSFVKMAAAIKDVEVDGAKFQGGIVD